MAVPVLAAVRRYAVNRYAVNRCAAWWCHQGVLLGLDQHFDRVEVTSNHVGLHVFKPGRLVAKDR